MALYGLSGFCMLALETLWMRKVSLWAGNTVVAATLVIAVFFLAAALGNLLGASLVERRKNSLFLYGCFEIAAAVTAALTFFLGEWIWSSVAAWPLEQVSVTLLLVGPPSLLSGFAFPILTEALVARPELRTIKAGPLYGMNLLGAALGVIAGGVLLPWCLGLRISFALVLNVQAAGGIAACLLFARRKIKREGDEQNPAQPTDKADRDASGLGLALLALSGLLSLATQLLLIQWARQILQGSVFAITAVLGVFITGLGFGSMLAASLRRRGQSPTSLLVIFTGLSALLLFIVPPVGRWLVGLNVNLGSLDPLGMLGESLGWSVVALLPLTICLGGVFPVAWELAAGDKQHQGAALGRMLAINKAAAGIGAALGVFVILPHLGLISGTNALAWSYLMISIIAMVCARRSFWLLDAVVILTAFGLWVATRAWPNLGVSPGENLVADYSGCYGPVSVVDKLSTGSRQIVINSRQHLSGTRSAMSSQRHEGWVPLLFCRNPERVLTIGMAAGISADAMLDFPIKQLDAVELIPEVVQAAHDHFGEWNHRLFSDPRVKIMIGDGRVVLGRLPDKFDAIICDLFFPAEDETANLYSRDFLSHARDHLQPDGLFCLWLPCYQQDEESAGMVIRTFLEVFPNAILVRSNFNPEQPVIGLLGSGKPIPVSQSFLAARLATLAGTFPGEQSPFFRSPENAALLFAGDLRSCNPSFEHFPLTTDDKPLFSFNGPREPRVGQRLIGIPFLNWIGNRFMEAKYPSCELDNTSPADLLGSMRAANHYFAAAVEQRVLPGDTRSEETRNNQVFKSLARAQGLSPKVQLPDEAQGQ